MSYEGAFVIGRTAACLPPRHCENPINKFIKKGNDDGGCDMLDIVIDKFFVIIRYEAISLHGRMAV
jgi:hypothetical protein